MNNVYLFLLLILQVNIYSYDIYAVVETPQMPVNGDADDPAIWINDLDKSNSLIFGTDKYNGIYSYDLNGKIINYSKAGNVNNIDIRKTYTNGNSYSLLYGSNRSDSSLSLWILDDAKTDKDLKLGNFMLPVKPNHLAEANMIVYGVCAGTHPEFGNIAFITEDEGSRVQMWRFDFLESNFTLLKEFNNSDAIQSEGCVYDEFLKNYYEEKNIFVEKSLSFGSLETIVRTKGEIIDALGADGIAVLNADSPHFDTWKNRAGERRVISFGENEKATVRASDININETGCCDFNLHIDDEVAQVHLKVMGQHNVFNALASAAACHGLKMSLSNIVTGLQAFEGVEGRLIEKVGLNDSVVIDDSYNANLSSMKSAIELVSKAEGTRIFVMGDIGELGQESQAIHSEIGEFVAQNKIDKFYTKGQMSRFAQAKAENHFASFDALIEQILIDINTAVQTDQNAKLTVLVKGSRSQKMENVVNALVQSDEEKV